LNLQEKQIDRITDPGQYFTPVVENAGMVDFAALIIGNNGFSGVAAGDLFALEFIREQRRVDDGQVIWAGIHRIGKGRALFEAALDGGLEVSGEEHLSPAAAALDRKIFPPAALGYIETQKPELDNLGEIYAWQDHQAFVLNQDTGGAIKGPGRADLFWGNGHYAEVAAGHMQHPGTLYFLVLKP